MIVDKTRREGNIVLALEGTIRLGESAEFFTRSLKRALEDETGHVLVDFTRINYIDSTGIGELVGYLQRFRSQQRQLILVNLSERIRQLLEMAHLADLFPIHGSVEEALAVEG